MAKKTEDAAKTAATPADQIKALIQALGHDPAKVAGLDISGRYARVYGKDRSLRSHTIGFGWNAEQVEEKP